MVGLGTSSEANFKWGMTGYFYDVDGATWLVPVSSDATSGVFAQLIRTGNTGDLPGTDHMNNGIDLLDPQGVAGNDEVVRVSWMGESGLTGDGTWSDSQGFEVDVAAAGINDGDILFARIWNRPAASWDGTPAGSLPDLSDPFSQVNVSGNILVYFDGGLFTYLDPGLNPPETYSMEQGADEKFGPGPNLNFTLQAVPEPSVFGLTFIGLLLVRFYRKMAKSA
jgi:hypothetical protein